VRPIARRVQPTESQLELTGTNRWCWRKLLYVCWL